MPIPIINNKWIIYFALTIIAFVCIAVFSYKTVLKNSNIEKIDLPPSQQLVTLCSQPYESLPELYKDISWYALSYEKGLHGYIKSYDLNMRPLILPGGHLGLSGNSLIERPSEFIDYYKNDLDTKNWSKIEVLDNSQFEIYRYTKRGRYFTFGLYKDTDSAGNTKSYRPFVEYNHCLSPKKKKLSITLNKPQAMKEIIIKSGNWVGVDQVNFEESKIIETIPVNASQEIYEVLLPSDVYSIDVTMQKNNSRVSSGLYLFEDTSISFDDHPIVTF